MACRQWEYEARSRYFIRRIFQLCYKSFYKLSKNLWHRKLSYFIRAMYHTFTTLSITHLGCWENTTRFSRVLPTSRVGYHAGKPIHRKCGLLLKCQIPRETVTFNFPRVLMFPDRGTQLQFSEEYLFGRRFEN